jgi:hypothetical protein
MKSSTYIFGKNDEACDLVIVQTTDAPLIPSTKFFYFEILAPSFVDITSFKSYGSSRIVSMYMKL